MMMMMMIPVLESVIDLRIEALIVVGFAVCLCPETSSLSAWPQPLNMAYELSEQKKVGLGLIGFGLFFSFLGVMLFFDRGLLALANIFCLLGIALLLGWRSTWSIFSSRSNYKGSASFFIGLILIFLRWPILGIILEICGCVGLFGGFWPSIKVFLYQIPVVGWILRYPVWLLDRLNRGVA
ncbi:hypothetical protein MLD38_018184 [Melastoma candidum]|uniref:Uncharacterized protein n=1 Tax=Melastoma candidum TaxID=119954 RepID=A0ACB9QT81_9MYRT|nr:hypothetical protein MLD38_018184 [Melastoma candidum]